MRLKLIFHYAGSFFIACMLLVFINVMYLRSQVYTESELYHFSPSNIVLEIKEDLETGRSLESYAERGIGIQLLNSSLHSVYDFNAPAISKADYTIQDFVSLYTHPEITLFAEELIINNEPFTLMLFVEPNIVKRTSYTFDVKQVEQAYNIYWLVGLNLIVLLMFSYIYTRSMSSPIYRIIDRISNLKDGDYHRYDTQKGLFLEVDQNLNQLADRLDLQTKERENQERIREEWISNLSHDIKTPLTSIIGHAELMGDVQFELSDEERENRCQSIVQKGNYITSLVEDLNLTTRLNAGSIRLNKSPVDVCKIIKENIDALNNDIEFSCSCNACIAELDATLFKRVIINILSNAHVHNPHGVAVWITVQVTEQNRIEIQIDDNGIGVEENQLDRIFYRYFRGTNTETITAGTGLGMAIAREIVEAHGGTISATKSPRGGLRVSITL